MRVTFFYGVHIEAGFCATHQVRLPSGKLEALHGHDWGVRVHFIADQLDPCDMVVDFDRARGVVEAILAPLKHANLNQHPDFASRNPTAEVVAEWLLKRIRAEQLPCVSRVEITEAPGCVATAEWGDF